MPFAYQGGLIADGFQALRQGGYAEIHGAAELGHADSLGVRAGQQTGARRATTRTVVELIESRPSGSQGVDVRRLNFTAVATDIRVTHVVDHNYDDVRPATRVWSGVY